MKIKSKEDFQDSELTEHREQIRNRNLAKTARNLIQHQMEEMERDDKYYRYGHKLSDF